MQIKLVGVVPLSLKQQLLWTWYSRQRKSFIVGDEHASVAVSPDNPTQPMPLAAEVRPHAGGTHPCNLPIPAALYDEFRAKDWHGFQFLEAAAYDHAFDKTGAAAGDLLRMLVFGPDYGHLVLHPATGLVVSLRGSSMDLLRRNDAGFEMLDQTRTRGRAVLAFAAHPGDPLIVYGDNNGAFHAHRIDNAKFGKATKFADRQRNASRLEFIHGGSVLFIGGMGYLAAYAYTGGKFSLLDETPMAVRDFVVLRDGELIFVNQGLHGISAWACPSRGFVKLAQVSCDGGVGQIAASDDGQYIAATSQQAAKLMMFQLGE